MNYKIEDDNTIIFIDKDEEIGSLIFNVSDYDEIESEYSDSVEDFDSTIMRKFDYNKPIVNIEDIWVNRKFQGQNLFRQELEIGMGVLKKKYTQFILRACSDNGFPEDKLVQIYSDNGFVPYQETEEDGTIMYMNSSMNECDMASPNGGLTFGDVAGMGEISFPTDKEPGSGDLPMPSGKLYKQVLPFDSFIKAKTPKKKKKKGHFHKEDEPCVHTDNPPIYDYVDDYRTYAERTKLSKDV